MCKKRSLHPGRDTKHNRGFQVGCYDLPTADLGQALGMPLGHQLWVLGLRKKKKKQMPIELQPYEANTSPGAYSQVRWVTESIL